jgi:hypothetical protein
MAAIGAAVACSLTTDLDGLHRPGESVAPPPDGALVDTTTVDAIPDATEDAPLPPCKASSVIDTPLTSSFGEWSPRSHKNAEHPKIGSFFGGNAAVLLPFVDTTPIPIDAGPDADGGPAFFTPPERRDAIGGLWLTTPVALRSFDLELDFHVRCTNGSSCADGLAVGWLDTTSAAGLTNENDGHRYGFPAAVSGGAVLVDTYQNKLDETDDPPSPSLQIVRLEGSKTLGLYKWTLASKSTDFPGANHKLAVSVRGTTVSVRYDGGAALTSTVPMVTRGLIGISAATGGQTDAVAVRNVKASFYECVP